MKAEAIATGEKLIESETALDRLRIWTGAGSRLEGGGAPGRRCGLAGVQGVPNPDGCRER
jgi:hypothetical protein